ncbi:MAG: hypothetical protein EPO13_06030 [Actinomycetota bacterium]|nr:MAG: hypothetical protein EPO13_06030 [Actinomycetota bacterium]
MRRDDDNSFLHAPGKQQEEPEWLSALNADDSSLCHREGTDKSAARWPRIARRDHPVWLMPEVHAGAMIMPDHPDTGRLPRGLEAR